MRAIRYEEARPDPEAYYRLFETTGWNAKYQRTAAELAQALRASWYVLTAFDDDRLVGVGRLVSDGVQYAVVFDMIVDPAYQRRGIGSALLQRLVQRCEAAGIRDIGLFAATGTQGFYSRHGFTPRPSNAPGMILRRVPA